MDADLRRLTKALLFAAEAHRNQRRKGAAQEPYLNHLIEVLDLVVQASDGTDMDMLLAALLHDVVEDTSTTYEDIAANFSAYPNHVRWMEFSPDANIDHRRVPNLRVFFSRKGISLPISTQAEDYGPGDLVTWDLGGGVPHIGIVVDHKSASDGRFLVVHNIGQGPRMEDVLFQWKVTGHYRYFGPGVAN